MNSGGAAEDGGGPREGGGRDPGREPGREPGVVGGARRKMERLRVEELEKASVEGRETLADKARATWGKLKGMFLGKRLIMDEMGGREGAN